VETKVNVLDSNNLDENILKEVANVIRNKGLVAFPTETVYGLGANALEPEAVKKIFLAKGRPQDNPLIIHIYDLDQISSLARNIPEISRKFMDKFWPGPMTIILEKTDLVPEVTSAGLSTIGIRMPKSIIARAIIKESGVPIAAPSANISGRPSPTDMERCVEDLKGKVDYIVGGEISEVGLESTIIDCTVTPPCILRPGGITLDMLKEVDKDIYIDQSIMKKPEKDFKPKAPGMKYRHYAPKAPVKIVNGELRKTIVRINEMVEAYRNDGKKVGIMATEETKDQYENALIISVGTRKNMDSIGRNLFETLRTFDDNEVDVILSEAFEEKGFGIAIMNRLKKSAGFNVIDV